MAKKIKSLSVIPSNVEVILESPVSTNFRCKMACDSLDIDIKKKSKHHLKIEGINLPEDWNIGLIYGASGSGKTTLAMELFGKDIFKSPLKLDEPIINQLPEGLNYEECAAILSGIGLNSVPCWVRPVKTLSNGQKARAEAALLMTQSNDIIVIDEWTSVVDRTVAKAMSHCLQKFARKYKKKIILLSCHYDVLEWIVPDWLIDCNEQKFHIKKSESFFFRKREELKFEVKKITKESWRFFSKYHYLSEKLPGGHLYLYGLFCEGKQIGFQCFASYVAGMQNIVHFNRTVIHPDYQGLGLGIKLVNITSGLLKKEKPGFKILGTFSSIPMYRAMRKDSQWKFLGLKRKMNKTHTGKIDRVKGYRDGGIKIFHFQYIGNQTVS